MMETGLKSARDLMTAEVVTVPPDMPVTMLAQLLAGRGISAAPVTDPEGGLLGIVTEADLLRSLAGAAEAPLSWLRTLVSSADRQATQYARTHGLDARSVMTTDVVTVAPGATVEHCAHLMEQRGVKRLPVVEDGRLVGIVSRADLLRAVLAPQPQAGGGGESQDERIRSALHAEMRSQPWAATHYTMTDVQDGVVTLHGSVHSDAMRRGLNVLAAGIDGVQRVEDRIVVNTRLLPRMLS